MDTSPFVPPVAATLPFAAWLCAVAIIPRAAPRVWESNLSKLAVSLPLGLPVLALYAWHDPSALAHAGRDYVSFMILLSSLFIISSGVLMDGDLEATPQVNVAFLAVGAMLASFIGTTGASMLLIRPLLHTNAERRGVVHTVVFFIFIVSNTGGCLTPLGDPPLLLGYLQGVPFTWTLRLLPAWLMTNALLLAIYFAWTGVCTRARRRSVSRSRRRGSNRFGLRAKRTSCSSSVSSQPPRGCRRSGVKAPWSRSRPSRCGEPARTCIT